MKPSKLAKVQKVISWVFIGALIIFELGIYGFAMLLEDPWTPTHAWVANFVDMPMIITGGGIALLTGIILMFTWIIQNLEIVWPLLTYKHWQMEWWSALDADYSASLDYNDDPPPMLCQMFLALVFLVLPLLCFQQTWVFGIATLGVWIVITIFLAFEGYRHKREWLRQYRAGKIVYN